MSWARCFAPLLPLTVLLAGALPAWCQNDVLYTWTIIVRNGVDDTPLAGARVLVTVVSGEVRALEYPPGRPPEIATIRGAPTDETGRVTVRLTPGVYDFTLSHPNFVSQKCGFSLRPVPIPGTLEMTYHWSLQMRPELGARSLLARVFARWRDDDGKEVTQPFGEAWLGRPEPGKSRTRLLNYVKSYQAEVTVRDENGWCLGFANTTDLGFARVSSPDLVIGDLVTVEVTAPGFRAARKQIIVGSAQESPKLTIEEMAHLVDPLLFPNSPDWNARPVGANKTTVFDYVAIPIDLEPQGGEACDLVVKAEDRGTGAGLSQADVALLNGRGEVLDEERTGPDGTTDPMRVAMRADGTAPPDLRVRVTREGFADTTSPVPPELLQPGSHVYRVGLPAATVEAECGDPDGCATAGFEAFVNWARRKPFRHFPAEMVAKLNAHCEWYLRGNKDDPNSIIADVSMLHLRHPEYVAQTRKSLEANAPGGPSITINGHPAWVFSPPRIRVAWMQRHCDVEVQLEGWGAASISRQDLSNLAEEVSRVFGECDHRPPPQQH